MDSFCRSIFIELFLESVDHRSAAGALEFIHHHTSDVSAAFRLDYLCRLRGGSHPGGLSGRKYASCIPLKPDLRRAPKAAAARYRSEALQPRFPARAT